MIIFFHSFRYFVFVSWIAAIAGGIGVFGFGFLSASGWWADLGILALGASAYSIFFVFISLIIQKAMVFSLLFAFGWETFVPNMPGGDLSFVSIITYLNALSRHPKAAVESEPGLLGAATGAFANAPISMGLAISILVIFSAVLMVVGMNWFTRFEYVPREDGD